MNQWKCICLIITVFTYHAVGHYWMPQPTPQRRWPDRTNHIPETHNNYYQQGGVNEDVSWRIIPGFQARNLPRDPPESCNKEGAEPVGSRRNLPQPTKPNLQVKDAPSIPDDVELRQAVASTEKHPAWNFLEQFECGESAADRIIGGTNAALGQFPWITRLGFLNFDYVDYKCGGALVSDRHILTAAHCIQSDYDLTTVRIGDHDGRTDPDCVLGVCAPPVQDRNLKKIITHENFNNPAMHNDIAILVLDKPVTINDYVSPICLPRGDLIAPVQLGEMVTAAGWGTINMTTEDRADILQFVSIPIVSPELCNQFGKSFRLSSSELCAGAQMNKDACAGDSGGPLSKIYDTPNGPKNYLIGVVSFGPSMCGIKKPGVYTSVSHFLPWVLDKIFEFRD